jgi:hypothetical protein
MQQQLDSCAELRLARVASCGAMLSWLRLGPADWAGWDWLRWGLPVDTIARHIVLRWKSSY